MLVCGEPTYLARRSLIMVIRYVCYDASSSNEEGERREEMEAEAEENTVVVRKCAFSDDVVGMYWDVG